MTSLQREITNECKRSAQRRGLSLRSYKSLIDTSDEVQDEYANCTTTINAKPLEKTNGMTKYNDSPSRKRDFIAKTS